MGSGVAWWMIISSLLWLGIAAVAVWALVRWLVGTRSPDAARSRDLPVQQTPQASALDILKARYARGEIDTPTFQVMRAELEATDAGTGHRDLRETTLSSSR